MWFWRRASKVARKPAASTGATAIEAPSASRKITLPFLLQSADGVTELGGALVLLGADGFFHVAMHLLEE